MTKRNLILFDDQAWADMRPLTWLRPVAELRIGLLTMTRRWELLLTGRASHVTQDYLAELYPVAIARDNYFINSSVLPTKSLVKRILSLSEGEAITQGDELIAARLDDKAIISISQHEEELAESVSTEEGYTIPGYTFDEKLTFLRRPFDIFIHNGEMLAFDIALVCGARHSKVISKTNTIVGSHPVFLEEGAVMEACILNTVDGPIYIGKDANIQEGSMLRGPLAICEGGRVKMGSKIYGNTTIGPYCTVGGEVSNVVFQGYSNKGHDGYLGNAVIGQWCNIGADSNASNLKNTYASVRVWDYEKDSFTDSGLQFCGLIMGDHSKCGINTMFNTGTVVGIAANIFGPGFPREFIPDFAWGGSGGMITHRLQKAFETAELVMQRRGKALSEEEKDVLEHVFALTSKHRRWESKQQSAS